MKIRLLSKGLALLLLVALAGLACVRESEEGKWAWGNILTINASKVKKLDEVRYAFNGQNWVIRPKEEGATLALVKVKVVNQKSARVLLSLDEEAANLRDSQNNSFKPLNYSDRAVTTSEEAPKNNPYFPFLWGDIELPQNFEVAGWFVFEVPEGEKFPSFVWEDTESIRVNF